jgi:hypothetical protein
MDAKTVTENIKVICHAGYRAEEAPLRFYPGEREIEVREIIDRWIGEEHRYFKVRGDDGARYILRYDTRGDYWEMTMFDRTG